MSTTESQQDEHRGVQPDAAPPAGEQIHLPGGSIIPLVVAIGITLLVIGTTVWWVWSLLGFIILVISIGIWIRDVRRDVDALPEDHHQRPRGP
jgi:membrane protein required for beta-lactamase induction